MELSPKRFNREWSVGRLNYKVEGGLTEALVVDYKASRSVFFASYIAYYCNYCRNPYVYNRYSGINGAEELGLLDGNAHRSNHPLVVLPVAPVFLRGFYALAKVFTAAIPPDTC